MRRVLATLVLLGSLFVSAPAYADCGCVVSLLVSAQTDGTDTTITETRRDTNGTTVVQVVYHADTGTVTWQASNTPGPVCV